MAQRILQQRFPKAQVESRCISPQRKGAPMSDHARTILTDKGFSVGHQATVLAAPDLNCDFLLCMEQRHVDFCSQLLHGESGPEIVLLDIPDPYGGSLEEYKKAYDEIQKSIDLWFFSRFLAKEA
jgi:protein-tyrosine-phosphatase